MHVCFQQETDPNAYIQEHHLNQTEDMDSLFSICQTVLEEHRPEVSAYLGGKTRLLEFFVGQVMKAVKGRIPPDKVRTALLKSINNIQYLH